MKLYNGLTWMIAGLIQTAALVSTAAMMDGNRLKVGDIVAVQAQQNQREKAKALRPLITPVKHTIQRAPT